MADRLEHAREALAAFGEAEFGRGYRQAIADLKAAADALLAPLAASADVVPARSAEPVAPAEPLAESEPPEQAGPALTPRQQRALDYLREHPGTTAHRARTFLGDDVNSFYQLARLGLVEKLGSAFYVCPASAVGESDAGTT